MADRPPVALDLLAKGLGNKGIARRPSISEQAVIIERGDASEIRDPARATRG